jgi:hypothetical protein
MLPLTKLQKYIQNNIKYYLFQIKEEREFITYIQYDINPSYVYEIIYDSIRYGFLYHFDKRNLLFVGKSHLIVVYDRNNLIVQIYSIQYPITKIFKFLHTGKLYCIDYVYDDPVRGPVMQEYNRSWCAYNYSSPCERFPFGGNKFSKEVVLLKQLQFNKYTKKLSHAMYKLLPNTKDYNYLYVVFDENRDIILIMFSRNDASISGIDSYVKDEKNLHFIHYHLELLATYCCNE